MYPAWCQNYSLRFRIVKRTRCLVCQKLIVHSNFSCIQYCVNCCQLRPVKTKEECVDFNRSLKDDQTFPKNKCLRDVKT